MAPVSLLDCPIKLIDNIVQCLPGSVLKDAPASCKRISRIAPPYLFRFSTFQITSLISISFVWSQRI
ncbi:hypothetical protein FOXG_19893 [Fusarium oxysporum f. sp. lycopersici 4287]|uniref:F-box domain-containing protein n=2 Tax=Fusarium oxysporum TaxID=5507 RepID=A0A0J9V9U4_FUSO4|nr:hypothetical protein FOXG_19893 [Fusarium oxysporum f. sp. lycopersici 4287]EXK27846.1 hypothetical protein FOMG_15694 [Fusarium oxysporum f. sp. melonis 26406]KNB07711.1 hypothetical protein FOXG_19893 [Fusarium oxysporum f. sp. lycopersici 4287]